MKRLYVPELEKKTAVISVRRIALLKDRSSGAILRLREATSSPKWYHAWVKLLKHSRLYEGVSSTVAFCGPPIDGFYERVDRKSTTRVQLSYCLLSIHSLPAAATCERCGVAVNCYCVGEGRIILLVF